MNSDVRITDMDIELAKCIMKSILAFNAPIGRLMELIRTMESGEPKEIIEESE
jgi:hypothetical protein